MAHHNRNLDALVDLIFYEILRFWWLDIGDSGCRLMTFWFWLCHQSVNSSNLADLSVFMDLLEWKSLFGTATLIKMFVVCIYFTFRLWNVNITFCATELPLNCKQIATGCADLQLNLSFKVMNSTFLVQIWIMHDYHFVIILLGALYKI